MGIVIQGAAEGGTLGTGTLIYFYSPSFLPLAS